jgi:hypothetical protein
MKQSILLSAFISLSQLAFSQVPKKVVVEHFTNTKCSVCASRNPGFYTNLNNQTSVIHLAIHPSSPYSACVFSQHNVAENDARTNYYGIYGGTPRLVIQGVVVSSGANYSAASIFTPYLGQTSPASIKIIQSKYGNDSIRSRIAIKTEAAHALGSLKLFVALAEDTINYTGSNGEPRHYDVFRKSLTGATGVTINLPTIIGDSVVYSMSSAVNSAWDFSRIRTIAILQEATSKAVVQSESVLAASNNITTGVSSIYALNQNITVFVADNAIVVKQANYSERTSLTVYDITGKVFLNKALVNTYETVSLPTISAGIYIYAIKSKESIVKTGKLIIN